MFDLQIVEGLLFIQIYLYLNIYAYFVCIYITYIYILYIYFIYISDVENDTAECYYTRCYRITHNCEDHTTT